MYVFIVMVKRRVSGAMKRRVAAEQEWRCNVCTSILHMSYEVDHRVPLWNHGSNKRWNLQALCAGCHANKTYMENLNRQNTRLNPNPNVCVCMRCNVRFSPYFTHTCRARIARRSVWCNS
jgi:hypothetical protein